MRRLLVLLLTLPLTAQTVSWREAVKQLGAWYASAEAVRIADNLLLYQRDIGGWDKNTDMAQPLGPKERQALEKEQHDPTAHSTIDNDSTYPQMRYLARVYSATKQQR